MARRPSHRPPSCRSGVENSAPEADDARRQRSEKQRRYRQRQHDAIDVVMIEIDRLARRKLVRWGNLTEAEAELRDRKAMARAVMEMLELALIEK